MNVQLARGGSTSVAHREMESVRRMNMLILRVSDMTVTSICGRFFRSRDPLDTSLAPFQVAREKRLESAGDLRQLMLLLMSCMLLVMSDMRVLMSCMRLPMSCLCLLMSCIRVSCYV